MLQPNYPSAKLPMSKQGEFNVAYGSGLMKVVDSIRLGWCTLYTRVFWKWQSDGFSIHFHICNTLSKYLHIAF